VLPAGTGKSVKVAVFCPPGAKADEALAAGAEVVGMDELAESMLAGNINYDVVIATPDAMRVVGKLGQVLGPRGLMPNPKVGTVSPDAAGAVRNAKAGQVRYRTDKGGIIHCTIGKASFEASALKDNLHALLADLVKAKPASSKGQYLQKISLSSTMGVGVVIDHASLTLAK
jgi:large subunit ribosomal protein L1